MMLQTGLVKSGLMFPVNDAAPRFGSTESAKAMCPPLGMLTGKNLQQATRLLDRFNGCLRDAGLSQPDAFSESFADTIENIGCCFAMEFPDFETKGRRFSFLLPKSDMFKGATLDVGPASYFVMQNVDLQAADGQPLNFEGTTFGSNNYEAALLNVNLAGANFKNGTIYGGFQACDLQGAHFEGAKILIGELRNCKLEGATYNKATEFPEGFDPQAAGMVLSL